MNLSLQACLISDALPLKVPYATCIGMGRNRTSVASCELLCTARTRTVSKDRQDGSLEKRDVVIPKDHLPRYGLCFDQFYVGTGLSTH